MSPKAITLPQLAAMALVPLGQAIRRFWLTRLERHYLMCADVEMQRAKEAQMNVAYYHKQAAMARSQRIEQGGV